jgi:hypothetical protein
LSLPLRLSLVSVDTKRAVENADHAADRASEHAANGACGLVAGLGALLHALDQPLGLGSVAGGENHHYGKAQP